MNGDSEVRLRVLGEAAERMSADAELADPADGRRVRVSITSEGLAVLREYSAQRERWLAGSLESVLSPTERQLLRLAADLLVRVADA